MRAFLLLSTLLLLACETNEATPEDFVRRRELDEVRAMCAANDRAAADVADLRRLVAEQSAVIEQLRARVDAVDARQIERLRLRDKKGNDYGVWAYGFVSYDERRQALVDWVSRIRADFPTDDCSGAVAYIHVNPPLPFKGGVMFADGVGALTVESDGTELAETKSSFSGGLCQQTGNRGQMRRVSVARDGYMPPPASDFVMPAPNVP